MDLQKKPPGRPPAQTNKRDKPGRTTETASSPARVKKLKKRWPVWKRVLGSFVIALAFSVLCTGGIVYALTMTRFDPYKLVQGATDPTVVYDRYGKVAFTIEPTGVRRVPLSRIPRYLQQALLATEDIRFYQNQGIDFRSILRSIVNDVFHHNGLQGASTITEQLAKITYLHDDRSLRYKLQEIFLALQIDRYFTKNQILDMYFNAANFNGATPGVENASEIYFQKDVSQLDLAQSALLAGMPQAPTEYDPFLHPHAALARRNLVLAQMAKYHFITVAQMTAAQKQPLGLAAQPGLVADGVPPQYASYRDYLYEEANRIGLGAQTLQAGGYKVYTDLDPELQMAAYDQFERGTYFPASAGGQMIEGGAVFLDPRTGGIEAIEGSRPQGYQYEGFDYATQSERSPGSSIKPLVVYGPAIQSGRWNANSLLYDGPLDINGYTPHDWEYHQTLNDQVTVRDALAMSWNIPAVWLLDQIGIATGLDFAEKAGLHFERQDFQHLDVALGDIHPGTNPLQMADAYSSFDNNGVRIPAHAIELVVSYSGATVYQASPAPVTVMSPSTAAQMVGLLRNNVVNGIAHEASVPGREVAGKTGSTAYVAPGQTYSPGDQDLWFCGFTPSVVGSVWEGYPNPGPNAYIQIGTSGLPAQLFSAILQQGLAGQPAQSFQEPVDSGGQPSVIPLIRGLRASYDRAQAAVHLRWDPVTDPNAYYMVFRGRAGENNLYYNRAIGSVTQTVYSDPLWQRGSFGFQVVAFDENTHAEVGQSGIADVTIGPPTGRR